VNPTTLNLIAVTIFLFVLSSLLGPLIHLSPAVPAIAAFGLLGLATVDTFSLQGRAGTLVVDWFARFSPEHRSRIIHHEAGHFLVAHLSQIPITGYTLTAWDAFRQGQPGYGGVTFNTQELDRELQQGKLSNQLLDRFCTVWMAGTAAEQLVYSEATGGADDRQKFRTLWAILKRPDVEGQQKEKWAAFQAKNLIQTHREAYDALVVGMEQGASVEECIQIIEQHPLL
jgi:hypothetical protein